MGKRHLHTRSDFLETSIEASAAIDKSIQGSSTTTPILNSTNASSTETDKNTCSQTSSDRKSLPRGHDLAGTILNEASNESTPTPLSETATLTPGDAGTPGSATPIATGMTNSSSEKKRRALETQKTTRRKSTPTQRSSTPRTLKVGCPALRSRLRSEETLTRIKSKRTSTGVK
jgi:hypothetical protein